MCAFLASNESSMAFTLPSCRILEFVDQLLVRNVHKNKLSSRMDKIKWCIMGCEVCYLFELASLRRPPDYAGKIPTRSFISLGFISLGLVYRPHQEKMRGQLSPHFLLSTLLCHENGAFKNVLQARGIENSGISFSFGIENVFRCSHDIKSSEIQARVFLKHESTMAVDCCVSEFVRCSVEGKHSMRFHSENTVNKLA